MLFLGRGSLGSDCRRDAGDWKHRLRGEEQIVSSGLSVSQHINFVCLFVFFLKKIITIDFKLLISNTISNHSLDTKRDATKPYHQVSYIERV